jgi:YVTN family beta-propeller protein
MKTIQKIGLLGCIFIIFVSANAQQNMKVVATYPVSGNGRYDYLITSRDGKLYVSHGDQVNILDEQTGKEIGVIQGLSGVHGIAFDYENNKGFISNGTANTVSVFNLQTNQVTNTIATDKNPDGIIYEPFTKTIITGNGRGGNMSVIDPKTEKVIHTISLNGGKPEGAVSNGEGLLFVNIENRSEIAVVDLKKFEVVKTIPLAPKGEAPTGLAIDVKNKLLFSGCSDNKTLVVVDYEKGSIANIYPIGEDCDYVAYNPTTETVFSSNGGDGTLTVLKRNGNSFSVSNVVTKPGARTMALNTKTNTVYLSAPDFSAEKDANGRKSMVPNSFKVLVVK